ncbi:Ig-like domain repeat protein, partial [Geomonas sp.]|uniref:Ig-like domain repeat protein n=1 Tax=Geomonas sp. TaxID=2651584 RepID=UPI002B4A55C6
MYVGRGLWWRVMQWALFLVLTLGAVTAHAYNISGTVSNTSGRTGRVYLSLQQNGFNTGLGVSIAPSDPGWPNFTIRGVANGSYSINAFVDGSGTGSIHPNDPTWNSPGSIAITNGDYAVGPNSTVSFTSHPTVLPVTPGGAMMMPGDNGTFIGWDEPKDNNGNKIADSYKVYWSTSKDTPFANPDGVITVPGGNQDFALLPAPNGSTLYVQVTANVAGSPESAPTAVTSLQIAPPAGGVTVSGTVNLSGIASPAGNLYLAIVDNKSDKGGPVAVAFVTGSPQLSNNFTISGVPSGTYAIYALIDVDGDGRIGPGDIMISDKQAPVVTVGGVNVTNQTVTLSKSNSYSSLNTAHYQDSNTPPNDGYQIVLNTRGGVEVPVNVTVTGGPGNNGINYPLDLGLSYESFNTWLNVGNNRPQLTDVYHLTVQYASGAASDLVDLPVTAVLDSFAIPTAPVGNWAYPMPAQVLYSWNAPSNPPASYTYSFWTNTPGFNNNNNSYDNMPSSTTSVNLSGLTYNDGSRNDWNINVVDAAGNMAQKSTWFTPTTGPAISSFTPDSAVPGTVVTVNGINFDPIAANNTVIFGCNQSATAQTATATQLTVVVPSNACPSSIQVQESASGKISNFSAQMLNILPTIQVSGRVTDFASGNNITGATVKVKSSILTTTQTTSGADPNNNYSFFNAPSNTNFTLIVTATGYDAAYSSTLNSTTPLTRNFALYAAGTVTNLNGGTAGLGVIRGRVVDQTVTGSNNGIAGATVTASGGFQVVYADNDSNQTPNASLTSTSANGVYYILNLADGTQVTTTASAAGYSFTPANVTGTAHADSMTFITNRGFPFISVTGTVTDLGTTPENGQPLNGVAVNQLGSSNSGNSGPNGVFTLNGLAGGTQFELSLNQTGFDPVYSGPITSPTNVTLPYPLIMFTPSQLSALGIANGQGAVIGRVVSSANNAQPISGMQVNASRPGYPGYQVEYYDSSVNGFSPTATGTDSSGLFLVLNVDEGAQVNLSAHNPFSTINGYLNLTTHGNAVSEVMVGCNVPQPNWGNLVNPSTVTTTTGTQTQSIYGQVQVPSLTNLFPGPADGLVAQLGYGPTGSAPTSPSWTWTPAAYDVSYNWGSQPGNYQYVGALTVSTAGSYDYAFRYSYYGGPYVYGDLQGMQNGNAPLPAAGKLTVNAPIPVSVGLSSSGTPSTYGQGVTFSAFINPQVPGNATGTVQFQIDGANFGAPVPVNSSWPFVTPSVSMPISTLTAGTHSVTAIYSGDATYG